MTFFSSRLTTIKEFIQTQRVPLNDLQNIFSWSYWTEGPLPAGSPYTLATAILVAVLLAGLIIWYLRARHLQKKLPIYDKLIAQLPTLIIFTTVISLLYAFFRAQEVQYLSSRLLLLTSLLIIFGWIGYLLYYVAKFLPAKKQAHLEKERFFRYLPKKRKK